MSTQLDFVQKNVLAGFTADSLRGKPWWYVVGQGMESRLFDGAIPQTEVERLFDFQIMNLPMFVEINGQNVEVPNKRAWVKEDTQDFLGVHADGYNGHMYTEWLLNNVMILVGQAQLANAGLLDKAAVAFVQIELPENIMVGGMAVRPFLLATTSFNGKIATTYKTGFTNVVCDNTFNGFMGEHNEAYKIKHTKYSEFKIADARDALGILEVTAEQTVAAIDSLLSVDVSDLQWQRFVEAHAPIGDDASKNAVTRAENKREALTMLWNTDERVSPWTGTAWGVVQAVNTFNQHMTTVRKGNTLEEKRMMRAIKGEIGNADMMTVQMLGSVLGKELVLS